MSIRRTLVTLAEIHYAFGLIGLDEYIERVKVARWLADDSNGNDPRIDGSQEGQSSEKENSEPKEGNAEVFVSKESTNKTPVPQNNGLIHFTVSIGKCKWVFTKSDPDSFPSVPHGHLNSKNNSWPKLDPYTGRVYSAKDKEDSKKELSKEELKELWNDEEFKSFCREMAVHYREMHSHYDFSEWHLRRLGLL